MRPSSNSSVAASSRRSPRRWRSLNDVPTDADGPRDGRPPRRTCVLIPCKSAGLDWMAVEAILRHRPAVPQPIGEKSLWQAQSRLRPAVVRDRPAHHAFLQLAQPDREDRRDGGVAKNLD